MIQRFLECGVMPVSTGMEEGGSGEEGPDGGHVRERAHMASYTSSLRPQRERDKAREREKGASRSAEIRRAVESVLHSSHST